MPAIAASDSTVQLGGDGFGGFVNDAGQTNPTYEFFPSEPGAKPITSPMLQRTLPANLFPLCWMLPSGRVFMQANFGTAILDYKAPQEFQLPDMPFAVRTYPASGGTVMLPLTPANNWTATILFCSGMNVAANAWSESAPWPTMKTDQSCVRITPDESQDYVNDDDVPMGRSMGNMILLPNGKIMYLNGAQTGVAGYGTGSNTIGDSYADNPALQPMMYDPDAQPGQRWSQDGLSPSTVPRMYHSSASLLPDGKSGSLCTQPMGVLIELVQAALSSPAQVHTPTSSSTTPSSRLNTALSTSFPRTTMSDVPSPRASLLPLPTVGPTSTSRSAQWTSETTQQRSCPRRPRSSSAPDSPRTRSTWHSRCSFSRTRSRATRTALACST